MSIKYQPTSGSGADDRLPVAPKGGTGERQPGRCEAEQIWVLINILRHKGEQSVTIHEDNDDFNDWRQSCVSVCSRRTNWRRVKFCGTNLLDALQRAACEQVKQNGADDWT